MNIKRLFQKGCKKVKHPSELELELFCVAISVILIFGGFLSAL